MATEKKKKSASVATAIKKKRKPRPNSDARARRELAEVSRAHLRASKPIVEQAYLFLDKIAELEIATKQLEAVLAIKTTNKKKTT